jgi:hypothetical protein
MGWFHVVLVVGCLLNGFILQAEKRRYFEEPIENERLVSLDKWMISTDHLSDVEPVIKALPWLGNHRIKVKWANLKTTMNARPAFGSLFKSPGKRVYVIRINQEKSFEGVQYQDVPFEARTGLWAHELMHIKDFESRRFWGLMQRGWQYLSKRGKMRFEHEIDQMVIDAGLGNSLYKWSYFVLEESTVSAKYKDFKRRTYLKPEDILINCNQSNYPQ